MKISKKVKIINPIENGSAITSRNRAVQFVQAGRAVFLGHNFIRFVETDPRNQAAKKRAASGYQAVDRLMSRAEMANIPFARPGLAFAEFLTARSQGYARQGPPIGRSLSVDFRKTERPTCMTMSTRG